MFIIVIILVYILSVFLSYKVNRIAYISSRTKCTDINPLVWVIPVINILYCIICLDDIVRTHLKHKWYYLNK